MNSVVISGHLADAPKTGAIEGKGIYAKFTLAAMSNFSLNKDPNWVECVCFGKIAEIAESFLRKGTGVIVMGEWRTSSYQTQDGSKRKTNECVISRLELLPKGASKEEAEKQKEQKAFEYSDVPF